MWKELYSKTNGNVKDYLFQKLEVVLSKDNRVKEFSKVSVFKIVCGHD